MNERVVAQLRRNREKGDRSLDKHMHAQSNLKCLISRRALKKNNHRNLPR